MTNDASEEQEESTEVVGIGRERQSEVYLQGLRGHMPPVPADLEELEAEAREAMSEEGYAYIAGGAGTESTILENREAFERWRIVPRMLRDVSERDPRVTLFGDTLPSPFLMAPIGVLETAHPAADLAVGRAAAQEGIPFVFSNQASEPMEEVAEEMGDTPRWFQLYWSTSDELVESLVGRAEDAGCSAIVVTLDTTLLGWRTRDLDLAYLPFLRGMGIAQYTSDPVFERLLGQADEDDDELSEGGGVNLAALKVLFDLVTSYPDGLIENLTSGKPLQAVEKFINIYSRPSLTWEDLSFLRELTDLPILLKGILHPEDGKKAVEHGVDGVVVSNHGGRQVDGAIGAFDALPKVVEAVDDRIPVLFDSGIRTGADIFKALALGAEAVLLGRPYCYGLAAGGQRGVRTILRNYKADFDLTMGLAGCRSVDEIGRQNITRRIDQ